MSRALSVSLVGIIDFYYDTKADDAKRFGVLLGMVFQPSLFASLGAEVRPSGGGRHVGLAPRTSARRLATSSKRAIARSPLHRPATIVRSLLLERLIMRHRTSPDPATNYCISPYKTATTFIADMFRGSRVQHEPLHHVTLKNIDDPHFLSCRKRYLQLDLESSGFLSLVAPAVLQPSATRRALYIIRDPEDWVGSVIDYFTGLSRHVGYNYIEELYFRRIGAAGVSRFYDLCEQDQSRVAQSLLRFWIETYRAAHQSDRCFIVRLDELAGSIERIEHHFEMSATNRAAWRRANRQRRPLDVRSLVDFTRYAKDIAALGY